MGRIIIPAKQITFPSINVQLTSSADTTNKKINSFVSGWVGGGVKNHATDRTHSNNEKKFN